MHAPVNSEGRAALQEPTSPSAKNFSPPKKARRKKVAKPRKHAALGPMSEAARAEMYDWLVLQVGATIDRPAGYHLIARAMSLHFNDNSGEAFPSLVTLGESCGMSKGTAAAMADLLEADGHVEIVERGNPGRGHSTKYAKAMKPLPDDVVTARRKARIGADRKRRKRSGNALLLPTSKRSAH